MFVPHVMLVFVQFQDTKRGSVTIKTNCRFTLYRLTRKFVRTSNIQQKYKSHPVYYVIYYLFPLLFSSCLLVHTVNTDAISSFYQYNDI